MKITLTAFLLIVVFNWCDALSPRSAVASDIPIVAHIDSALARLVQMQQKIDDIHPILSRLHPVAVVEGGELYIFDVDSTARQYRFQEKDSLPFPMPKGVRASFPLSAYGNRPTCVVSPEVFDQPEGYATIFHEFVHCTQTQTVEFRLKEKLVIAQEAMQAKNYSWELNHPFPYQDSLFVKEYTSFLSALKEGDGKKVVESRRALKQHLPQADFEYMIWEEWKEGFARFIENKIRSRLGIPANHVGADLPYDRVTFYRGGELFIDFLIHQHEGLATDTEMLFGRMLGTEH